MRKNSVKNTRINGEVLKELSNIIRSEIKDPRINPMTSVVSVEVAPDLKTDRKSTRLNSSHLKLSRMPSSA